MNLINRAVEYGSVLSILRAAPPHSVEVTGWVPQSVEPCSSAPIVNGQVEVTAYGQQEVTTGGQVEVPTPRKISGFFGLGPTPSASGLAHAPRLPVCEHHDVVVEQSVEHADSGCVLG